MRNSAVILLISGTALFLGSCSRRSYPVENRYPPEPYPENRPVVVYEPRPLPPGQAKKVYGDRNAREYAHGHRKYKQKRYYPAYGQRGYPLIIIRTPDMVITRNSQGRVYFRNHDGLFYWLRDDDRYYLDERYINDVQYENDEYRRWRNTVQPRYDDRYRNDRRRDDD